MAWRFDPRSVVATASKALLVLAALAHGPSAVAGPSAVVGEAPGVATMLVAAAGHKRELAVTLWYPAQSGGTPTLVGDNAVFAGVEGRRDAPIADGRFPTVLLAHGGLRSAPDLGGWLAARLADQGFLVAVVQGPRLGPNDAALAPAEIWQRPADLSTALTALAEDPVWSQHAALERVAAVGFFLGGTSVLSLAGGRLSGDALERACAEGGRGLDCAWLVAGGVELKARDPADLAGSRHDPRIGLAIAVDPEYSASFEGLTEIAIPVEVINLGRPDTIPPGLDASGLASPRIVYTALPDATRFSAFSLCKPQGAAILAEDGGDDAICRDAENRERAHRDLAALIAARLKERRPE